LYAPVAKTIAGEDRAGGLVAGLRFVQVAAPESYAHVSLLPYKMRRLAASSKTITWRGGGRVAAFTSAHVPPRTSKDQRSLAGVQVKSLLGIEHPPKRTTRPLAGSYVIALPNRLGGLTTVLTLAHALLVSS
jgi:hypothetical protein